MNEIWVPIKGFENSYEISNYGRIRSVDRIVTFRDGRQRVYKGQYIPLKRNPNGYIQIMLWEHHKGYNKYIHRLVAEHFVKNIDKKEIVNHKDGNKLNNHFSNLEWVSYSENSFHSYHILKQKRPCSCGYFYKTICINNNGEITEYSSVKQASRKTNISETQIYRIANTDKTSCSGLKFKILKAV